MRAVATALAFAAFAACKNKSSSSSEAASAASSEITGTLVVSGQPAALKACKPGRGFGTYVEVVTDVGKLRFEDKALYWTDDATSILRGTKLDCEKLDRSWGGGQRLDGSSYFRGTLAFACTGKQVVVTGDLRLDCGDITPEERAQLDKNSADMKAHQRAMAEHGSSGSGSHGGSSAGSATGGSSAAGSYTGGSSSAGSSAGGSSAAGSSTGGGSSAAGSSSAGDATMATDAECRDLLAHLVDLEFARVDATASADRDRQKAAVIDAQSAEFMATCRKTPQQQVRCALAAKDHDAVSACDVRDRALRRDARSGR